MEHRSDHVTFPLLTILGALCLLGTVIMLLTSLTRLIINAKTVGTPRVYTEIYEKRFQPFSIVNTGVMEAAGEKSPQEVYQSVCFSCHETGTSGAPIHGDHDAWKVRFDERGLAGLKKSSLEGFNNGLMPPRGGDPRLSDAEVHGALEYMLKDADIEFEAADVKKSDDKAKDDKSDAKEEKNDKDEGDVA